MPLLTLIRILFLFFRTLLAWRSGKVLFILFPDSSRAAYAAPSGYVMVLRRSSFRAIHRRMLSILRSILIIGVIFYYSPARQQGEGTAAVEALFAPRTSAPAVAGPAPATGDPGHLETVWKALPDSAKQAVVDRILSGSGLPVASAARPSDTLLPEDREPAASKPRT